MTKATERIALLSPSPGTQRHLLAHRYGRPGARPKAYLQASIHADETPAMLVAHHLMRLLDEAEAQGAIAGEIILVPVANPIGLSQTLNDHLLGRHEASGGGNFNRSWPDLYPTLPDRVAGKLGADAARNIEVVRAALREIAAELKPNSEFSSLRVALTRLAVDADIVVDMHCDDEALMHLYLIPQHWPQAGDLSAEIGSRATLLAEDSGGHSFDETFSTPWVKLAAAVPAGTPISPVCLAATIEYRGQAETSDEINLPDAKSLFRFLQRRGLIAGNPGPQPKPLCDAFACCRHRLLPPGHRGQGRQGRRHRRDPEPLGRQPRSGTPSPSCRNRRSFADPPTTQDGPARRFCGQDRRHRAAGLAPGLPARGLIGQSRGLTAAGGSADFGRRAPGDGNPAADRTRQRHGAMGFQHAGQMRLQR
jgi:predicted deacylase